jgi:hypothetical protein
MSLRKIDDFQTYAKKRRLNQGDAPAEPGVGYPPPEAEAASLQALAKWSDSNTQKLQELVDAAYASNKQEEPVLGRVELHDITKESFDLMVAAPDALQGLLKEKEARDKAVAEALALLREASNQCFNQRLPQYINLTIQKALLALE